MSNVIFPYKHADPHLLSIAGFEYLLPQLSYQLAEDVIDVQLQQKDLPIIKLNKRAPSWTPELHELTINQILQFNDFDKLKESNGIASDFSQIGVAVKVHSRFSNYQEIFSLSGDDEKGCFVFEHTYLANELRGKISFEYFLYLEESVAQRHFQAKLQGAILSLVSLIEYTVIIDGEGSTFPIREVNQPGEPLWSIRMEWTDALCDPFDESCLSLDINRAHKHYKDISKGKTKISLYLLDEIITSAMILITQRVIFEDKISIDDIQEFAEDSSIGKIIWYWYTTFDIDVSSIARISNSFHEYLEVTSGGK